MSLMMRRMMMMRRIVMMSRVLVRGLYGVLDGEWVVRFV